MQFSVLLNSLIKSNKTVVWLTGILRLLLGAVFLYSGFAKAVDPWGSQYKIADYFQAWGLSFSDGIYLTAGCILSGFEFLIGTLLVTGAFRRAVSWCVTIFMIVMTALTLYIWIADPVSDCGCFGDAFVLSNSATFWKNVVLLELSLILLKWNKQVRSLIHRRLQWLILIFTGLYVIVIQVIGYHIQPLVDFRPYPVGSNLKEIIEESDTDDRMMFIYEKDGQQKEFDVNNLPDDSWTFVERVENEAPNHHPGLAIFDDEEDVTSEVISGEGREFILTVTNPEEHKLSRSEMANRLKAYADSTDATMIAIVAIPTDSLQSWIDYTGADYDVFTAEDTDLKMLVRGEAGLTMLEDGEIKWKRNLGAIDPYFPEDATGVDGISAIENSGLLTRLTVAWLLFLFVTYVLSRFYRRWNRHCQQRKKKKELKKDVKTDKSQPNEEING